MHYSTVSWEAPETTTDKTKSEKQGALYAAQQYLVLFIVDAKVDISWLYRLLPVWRWAAPKILRCGAQAVDTLVVEAVEA